MPILVQTIVKNCQFKLDAEGSDRYLFDQDYKPAINSAIDTAVAIFNAAFGQNKISPESLRELVKIKVWQASQFSRVAIKDSDINHSFWTILAVYPKPKTNKGVSSSPTANDSESKFRADLSFKQSVYSAKRLNFEEWNKNVNNPFMPGNSVLKGGLTEYAYLDFANYESSSYTGNAGFSEIQIRPDIPGELVAIAYIKYPSRVSAIGDSIEFPQSLTEILTELTLHHISFKQGDGTNLEGMADKYINRLVSLMK